MIPAALIGILATTRLGAMHAVVFGGFAGPSLAQRIESARPAAVLTASCGIDGAKAPASYKTLVNDAMARSSFKPRHVVVWQREQLRWDPVEESRGEQDWAALVESAKRRKLTADCVPVGSNDGLYILYTSGGLPSPSHGFLFFISQYPQP